MGYIKGKDVNLSEKRTNLHPPPSHRPSFPLGEDT